MTFFRRLIPVVTLVALALAGAPGHVEAAATACPAQYLDGQAPDIVNPKLAVALRELCYRQFAVVHSGVSRGPLTSAEHLTRARVIAARQQERENAFHEEGRLPENERSTLDDFRRSGYDRGHMSPSGDQPDPESQNESFSLANMVPQSPECNRGVWEHIESSVRDMAMSENDVYVITGPIFQGSSLERLHGRVLVPTAVYKAVYVPSLRLAGAYVAANAPGGEWHEVSLTELRGLTGLDMFPSLPHSAKDRAPALPAPETGRHRSY